MVFSCNEKILSSIQIAQEKICAHLRGTQMEMGTRSSRIAGVKMRVMYGRNFLILWWVRRRILRCSMTLLPYSASIILLRLSI